MSLDARIDSILSAALAAGVMPNMVVLVGDRDGVRCLSAAGARIAGDPGSGDVGPACLYRLGSMTKPIVIVAALQLCERGLLDLDVPVGDHLPAFDRLQVLEGFDGDTPRMRPPASRALVRHLITQTAGLGYDFINDAQRRWQEVTGIPNSWAGDERVFSSPLHFDPGTAGQYGLGVDWLGRIIESVTGQGLDRALQEMVTGPLGMADTTFAPSAAQRRVLVPIHLPNGSGGWGATELDFPLAPDWWSGGHGLYSTAADYLRFTRMLLNDGELDGVRVLQARTVDEVFQDHNVVAEIPVGIPTADPALAMETGPRPGVGLGLLVNKIDLPGMRAAWSGSFAGLYNTCFVVDRTRGRTWVALSQCAGGHLPAMLEVNIALEKAIYAEPG
jgi:methyl acetate hydrolase